MVRPQVIQRKTQILPKSLNNVSPHKLKLQESEVLCGEILFGGV